MVGRDQKRCEEEEEGEVGEEEEATVRGGEVERKRKQSRRRERRDQVAEREANVGQTTDPPHLGQRSEGWGFKPHRGTKMEAVTGPPLTLATR